MTLRSCWTLFWATPVGAATGAFLRVFAAASAAEWMQAGQPVFDLSGAEVAEMVEIGVQAGAALVIVNWFGPWERRYGKTPRVQDPAV